MIKDEEIKKEIVDQLWWDERVDASNIKVKVDEGKVALEGEVPSFRSRVAAENGACTILGVNYVDNKLSVRHPAGSLLSVKGLESNVRNVLEWDPDIDSKKIKVKAEGGVILLEGTIESLWKKILAEDIVYRVVGVRSVDNRLAVVPSKKVNDRVIAKNIVDALTRCYPLDSEDIHVEVKDGRVELSGKVPSWHAKNLAFETAVNTLGVKEVKHHDLMVEQGKSS